MASRGVGRTRVKRQSKEAVQLDLFIPHDYGYEFKVIILTSLLPQRPGEPGGHLHRTQIRKSVDYVPTRTEWAITSLLHYLEALNIS